MYRSFVVREVHSHRIPPPGPSGGSTDPSSYERPIVDDQIAVTGDATALTNDVDRTIWDAVARDPTIDRPAGTRQLAAFLGCSRKASTDHRGNDQIGGVGTTEVQDVS